MSAKSASRPFTVSVHILFGKMLRSLVSHSSPVTQDGAMKDAIVPGRKTFARVRRYLQWTNRDARREGIIITFDPIDRIKLRERLSNPAV